MEYELHFSGFGPSAGREGTVPNQRVYLTHLSFVLLGLILQMQDLERNHHVSKPINIISLETKVNFISKHDQVNSLQSSFCVNEENVKKKKAGAKHYKKTGHRRRHTAQCSGLIEKGVKRSQRPSTQHSARTTHPSTKFFCLNSFGSCNVLK